LPEARSTPSPACASPGDSVAMVRTRAREAGCLLRENALLRGTPRVEPTRPRNGSAEGGTRGSSVAMFVFRNVVASARLTGRGEERGKKKSEADVLRSRQRSCRFACRRVWKRGGNRVRDSSKNGGSPLIRSAKDFVPKRVEQRVVAFDDTRISRANPSAHARFVFASLPERGRLERHTARSFARPPSSRAGPPLRCPRASAPPWGVARGDS